MNNKFLLLEQKAKKGNVVAQHNLAYEYHKNHENKKALYWWKKAALEKKVAKLEKQVKHLINEIEE
jgi:hypothetical protein